MVTQYFCQGCSETFLADDPVPMPSGKPQYPECPNSPEAVYFAQFFLPEAERDIPDDLMAMLEKSDLQHPVTLHVVEPPTPPSVAAPPPASTMSATKAAQTAGGAGASGKASPSVKSAAPPTSPWSKFQFKKDTPEEAKARLAENKRRKEEEAIRRNVAHAEQEARKLLGRIERMIEGGGGQKSANFPDDLEYGTKASGKPLTATRDTIRRCSQLWCAKAHTTYRAPAWKQLWKTYQANFELDIVPGDRSKGKHNVHVTVKE